MADPGAFDPLRTYVHLGHDGRATPLEVTDTFWRDLEAKAGRLGPGRLVSCYAFESDWDSWEVHPDGDEFVCLLSGAMDFVLELAEGERVVELRGGPAFLLVPRGTWHTARVHAPSVGLFVTAGEGTRHRPRRDA